MSRSQWTPLAVGIFAIATGAVPVAAAADNEKNAAPTQPPADAKAEVRTVTKVSAKIGPEEADRFEVLLDFNDAPEAKEWALSAANYGIKWYPKLCELLASDEFEPAKEVTLVFKPMDGVAHTSGSTITISSNWIREHPEDLGMVAHELVHVVQNYGRGDGDNEAPGWLTEGIADYVRYYVVEPDSEQAGFDHDRSDYKAGYQPAAGLLNWIEHRRPGAVAKLNALLREGTYTPGASSELAGGEPEALWKQFKASRDKP